MVKCCRLALYDFSALDRADLLRLTKPTKMGSHRSGGNRKAGSIRREGFKKGDRMGNQSDHRWTKAVAKRKREHPSVHETDDTIEDNHTPVNGETSPNVSNPSGGSKKKKESAQEIKQRQRNAKRRRREMHDFERMASDGMIRTKPDQFLWAKYVEWVGSKLSNAEKKAERWTKEQIHGIEEDTNKSLMESVKEVVGPDYISQGAWKKSASAKPGIACIVLTSSALRAVELAKSVYDGRPVGKLFSKHIKIEEQQKWLATCCVKGLAPSAAGTAKRVQRLVEEGYMTLAHTVALIIDFKRDNRERNILDFNATKDELFEFLHDHARPFINEQKMKVLLLAPQKPGKGDVETPIPASPRSRSLEEDGNEDRGMEPEQEDD